MKFPCQFVIAIAIAIANPAQAAAEYRLTTILPWISQNSTSVDIGIIVNGTYYLSDRTNAVVHIVDLASSTETGRITGFKGATVVNGTVDKPTSGPNGLLYIPGRNELYVGDGDGTVKVVDLSSNTVVDTIPLNISKRADEMTYDANNKLAIVTGPDDDIAILAFISVTDRKLIHKISFDNATNGIEQPAWNPADGLVYVSVPESIVNTGGEIDVIETTNFTTTRIIPVDECSSHGIVFGPTNQLLLGCSQDAILADSVGHTLVIDVTSGKTIETTNGIGGADEVAYNPTLNYYYVAAYQYQVNGSATGAADPEVGIIDAATGTLLQTLQTDNVTAHSVAVDPKSNKMVIPLAGKGIAIYDFVNGTSTANGTAATATPTALTTSAGTSLGACSVSLFAFVVAVVIGAGMA
ncbi:YVTN repeat-like/Quino protein amine dehydrogenase [Acephala macrosclerotiorum]|nr:YVTN repeat-like/Quino protein amine dehydrogenase [Acephala macrosclerotiorum]